MPPPTSSGQQFTTARKRQQQATTPSNRELFSFNRASLREFDIPVNEIKPLQPRLAEKAGLKSLQMSRSSNDVAQATVQTSLSSQYLLSQETLNQSVVDDAAATSAAATEDDQVAALQTGEDAISFFAKSGPQTDTKFVTLNRAPQLAKFRPYDLEVVSPRHAQPDHYSMSLRGVVHDVPGKPTSFTPMAQWMKDASNFNILSSLGVFKNYLVRKCFQSWCGNVRFKLYCQQRKKLSQALFLGMETFCVPLLEIKKAALEMEDVVLIELGLGVGQKTFEGSAFADHQLGQRTNATKKFEEAMEKMQATVQRVCISVRNLAKTESRDEQADTQLEQKSKSMQQAKMEEANRKALVKRSRREARMLVHFIRLIDYVTVEHLVDLVICSVAKFLGELLVPRKVGLFATDIAFDHDSTFFTPNKSIVLDMLQHVIDATIQSANSVTRIIFTQPYSQLVNNHLGPTQGAADEGSGDGSDGSPAAGGSERPSTAGIIRDSTAFITHMNNIRNKVSTDFDDAKEYVEVFDEVRILDYKPPIVN